MELKQYNSNIEDDFITINNIRYEKEYLRKSLPYIIEFNDKTKDYYLINREYEYIGYNIKNVKEIEEFSNKLPIDFKYVRIYLYDDGTKPWNHKKYMIKYIEKYLEIKSNLNNCKNHISFLPFMDFFIY